MKKFLVFLFALGLLAACDKPEDDGDGPGEILSTAFLIGNTGVISAGCTAVEFVNASENADAYQWEFGDGTQSAEENPQHIYANPGTYTAVLTARQGATSQTAARTVHVTVVPTFTHIYQENYGTNNLVKTNDGGYLVARTRLVSPVTEVLLMKISENGTVLWSRVFGGGLVTDAIATTDGGFVLVGNFHNPSGNADADAVVWRLDAAGNELWRRDFGGNFGQQFNAVVQLSNGNIWCGGYSDDSWPRTGFFANLDAAGNTIAYGDMGLGFGEFTITQMAVAADGNVVLCGEGDTDPGSAINRKLFINKRNGQDWSSLWVTPPHGVTNNETPCRLIRTSDQGFVLLYFNNGTGMSEVRILKIDAGGNTVFQQDITNSARAWDVVELPDGTFTVTGARGGDLMLMNVSATGAQVNWSRFKDSGSTFESGYDLDATSDGGYLISGNSGSPGAETLWILKTDCTGN